MRCRTALFISLLAAALIVGCGGGSSHVMHARIAANAGGELDFPGGARLVVPPGALSADTDVAIANVKPDAAHGGAPETLTAVGSRYEIDLGNQPLHVPARLELPFGNASMPADASPDGLFLAYFDPQTNAWTPSGGIVDDTKHVVATEITHASWWSLFTQTAAGTPLLASDRRAINLPSNAGDPAVLCPYLGIVKSSGGSYSPCVDLSDAQLDPINLVFYGLSEQEILAALDAAGWTPGIICPALSALEGNQVLFAGVGRPQVFPFSDQRYLGENCASSALAGQYHVRLFPVPSSNWVLAGVHFERGIPHQPAAPWTLAADAAAGAFGTQYRVEPHRLLLQRDCAFTCTFRGLPMDGWVTLVTPKGSALSQPLLFLSPNHGPPGARIVVGGAGFPSRQPVTVYGDAGRTNLLLNTVSTDDNGMFLYVGFVPMNAPAGTYAVRAQTSDSVFAETLFTVEPGGSPPPTASSPPVGSPQAAFASPPLVSPPGIASPPPGPISPPSDLPPGAISPPPAPAPVVPNSPPPAPTPVPPSSPPGLISPPPAPTPVPPNSPPQALRSPTPVSPPGR